MHTAYIVMSGEHFGDFLTEGHMAAPRVKSVTWQRGRSGLQVATRFPTEYAARLAMGQVQGACGPMRIEEIAQGD